MVFFPRILRVMVACVGVFADEKCRIELFPKLAESKSGMHCVCRCVDMTQHDLGQVIGLLR